MLEIYKIMQEIYNKIKRFECGCELPVISKNKGSKCPKHNEPIKEVILKCELCGKFSILPPTHYNRQYCNECAKLPRNEKRSGVRLLIPKYAYRSYKEVGDELGISPHAVEATEKRALMKIMIRLKNSDVTFEDVINYIKYNCDEDTIEKYLGGE